MQAIKICSQEVLGSIHSRHCRQKLAMKGLIKTRKRCNGL